MSHRDRIERRLLMVAASVRDETHAQRMFREDGIEVDFCRSLYDVADCIEDGAAVVLLTDQIVRRDPLQPLLDVLRAQPAWSNVPLILTTTDERLSWFAQQPGINATLLRQPIHVETLLSVVRSAIASRLKQYEVRDLLEQQERTQGELRDIDRRKDEFLATLAHELRNPISPIKNSLDLLDMSQRSLQEEIELRGIMQRQVHQLTRLVDDLLDVSRITRGKIRLDRKCFDFREAIQAGIESSRPFIVQSHQELHVDLGDSEIHVDGDLARLAQCVANLLNNAAKYTPPNGKIWLELRPSSSMVELFVRDNGIGIATEQLASVFELFQQHDVDQERGQAGLGIGLTLVRSLLDLHAGSIDVQSDGVNKGSTFTMRLPRVIAAASESVATSFSEDAYSKRSFDVLVVEDTRAIRIVLRQLFEAMGHNVVMAEDGCEGLKLAKKLSPEVIFSDISMPKMNGLELAKQLRRDREFDRTTLIAMTGYGRNEDREEALAAGFNRHLTKPVDVNELREVFRAICSATA